MSGLLPYQSDRCAFIMFLNEAKQLSFIQPLQSGGPPGAERAVPPLTGSGLGGRPTTLAPAVRRTDWLPWLIYQALKASSDSLHQVLLFRAAACGLLAGRPPEG